MSAHQAFVMQMMLTVLRNLEESDPPRYAELIAALQGLVARYAAEHYHDSPVAPVRLAAPRPQLPGSIQAPSHEEPNQFPGSIQAPSYARHDQDVLTVGSDDDEPVPPAAALPAAEPPVALPAAPPNAAAVLAPALSSPAIRAYRTALTNDQVAKAQKLNRDQFLQQLHVHGLHTTLVPPPVCKLVGLATRLICNEVTTPLLTDTDPSAAHALAHAANHSSLRYTALTGEALDLPSLVSGIPLHDTPPPTLLLVQLRFSNIPGPPQTVGVLYSPDRGYDMGGLIFPSSKEFAYSVGHTLVKNALLRDPDTRNRRLWGNLTAYVWPLSTTNNKARLNSSVDAAYILYRANTQAPEDSKPPAVPDAKRAKHYF